jgi:F-type H+-transporting ATPase subunit delta
MRETRVADRYAHALFEVALARGLMDTLAADLFQLKTFCREEKKFLAFLQAPQVMSADKVQLIKTLFASRLSQSLVSFLLLLIEKHRIEFLNEIAVEFEKRLENYRGLIKASVTTAIPIDDTYKAHLQARLEKMTGKKIEIVHKIDKGIIGGIIVQLNYQVIDRSVRHELNSLKHDLLALKVY